MKKIVTAFLSLLLIFSLAGCSSAPSDEKIKTALDEGTITIEDAKSKGWIDEAWIEANFEQIEAKSKIYLFDPFETTYLDGTPASSSLIEGNMCLVFFNTAVESAPEKLKIYDSIADEMKELGVPILGIITDQDPSAAKETLSDLKFPVLVFNKEMQASLQDYDELIEQDVVSVFTKDGGFYTAWNSKAEKDDLLDFAGVLANEE